MPKPAMVMRTAERINVKELSRNEDGQLCVDPDGLYRHIGDVTTAKILVDGLEVKRWFAHTLIDTQLGPFPNRVKAVKALLDWSGYEEAHAHDTMSPLF